MSHQMIHRSIAGMAISVAQARDERQAAVAHERLQETDLQFQVDVSGTASNGSGWSDVTIKFDHVVFQAPAMRHHGNPLEEPHFHSGFVLDAGPPVIVSAIVRQWLTDTSGNFVGARVSIGVTDPNNSGSQYKGRVHLTFQGNAVVADPTLEESA